MYFSHFSAPPILGFTTKTSPPDTANSKHPKTATLQTFHVSINHSAHYVDAKIDIAAILENPSTQKPGFSLKADETGQKLLVTLTPSALANADNFTFADKAFRSLLTLLSKCRLESKNLQGILDRYEDYLTANELKQYSMKPAKHAFSVTRRAST